MCQFDLRLLLGSLRHAVTALKLALHPRLPYLQPGHLHDLGMLT